MRFLYSVFLFAATGVAINSPTAMDQDNESLEPYFEDERGLGDKKPVVDGHDGSLFWGVSAKHLLDKRDDYDGPAFWGIDSKYYLMKQEGKDWTVGMAMPEKSQGIWRRNKAAVQIEKAKKILAKDEPKTLSDLLGETDDVRVIYAKKKKRIVEFCSKGRWWAGLFRDKVLFDHWDVEGYAATQTFVVEPKDVLVIANGEFIRDNIDALKAAVCNVEKFVSYDGKPYPFPQPLDLLGKYLSDSLKKSTDGQKHALVAFRIEWFMIPEQVKSESSS